MSTKIWTAADGITLAERRNDLQLSRRELAELSKLTQSRIWRLEHSESFEADADKADAALFMSTLRKWSEANPDGKPKRTTSKSGANTEAQLIFVLHGLERLAGHVEKKTIPALKAKKVSTAHLVDLTATLRQLAEDTKQVTA